MIDKTYIRNRRIRSAKIFADQLKTDPEQEQRQKKQECVLCYYTISIAGQGFTNYTCLGCKGVFSHSNTHVPALCFECAKKSDLCVQCGAELEIQ